jgi:hypothetical protein
MNKIDLIIDNIMYAKILKESAHQDELLEEALAAARELKALQPVARVNSEGFIVELGLGLSSGTKLYALDEVTK